MKANKALRRNYELQEAEKMFQEHYPSADVDIYGVSNYLRAYSIPSKDREAGYGWDSQRHYQSPPQGDAVRWYRDNQLHRYMIFGK